MSETQVVEPVNEEVVLDDNAAAIAEQQAELDEINNPDQPAEPEPEPEQNAEPQAQPDDKAANLQKALSESRYAQRQTQRELRQLRELIANASPQQNAPQEQQVELDPDGDPMGTLRYVTARLRAYEHQEQQRQKQAEQEQAQQQFEAEIQNTWREGAEVFRAEQPDYDKAAEYLIESRISELKSLGHYSQQELALQGFAPQQIDNPNHPNPVWSIEAHVKNEYQGLASTSRQNGQNPAALVYGQAVARGYVASQDPPADDPNPQPAPAPENAPAQQQLEAIKKGQQAPKTTRGSGGATASGTVTEEMLNNAKTDKEFNELWSRYEKQYAS
jgi:hypothetical protein